MEEAKRQKGMLTTLDTSSSSSSHHQDMWDFGCLDKDIMFDLLAPMHTKDLLVLKRVSKQYRALTCDGSFIRVQSKKKEPLSGFFIQQHFEHIKVDIRTINYVPIKAGSTRVHQEVFKFLPEDVTILSSCNGLICCRTCFPSLKPSIYVCNLLTKDWIKIEWIEHFDKMISSIVLAFDPFVDVTENSIKFKVVKVEQVEEHEDSLWFSFAIFCSETMKWKISKEICWCNDNLLDNKNNGLLIKGVLHWLTESGQVLTFEVENELTWLIAAPLPFDQFDTVPDVCIGESDGQLHYIMISEDGFQLWSLDDYFEIKWSLKCSRTLSEMEKEHPDHLCHLQGRVTLCKKIRQRWMDPLAFKDGVLLMRVSNDIYLYHIEASWVEKVSPVSKLGHEYSMDFTALPYSMSLVPLKQA